MVNRKSTIVSVCRTCPLSPALLGDALTWHRGGIELFATMGPPITWYLLPITWHRGYLVLFFSGHKQVQGTDIYFL